MFAPIPPETEAVASRILDAAFQVHRTLGPGLLESVYETCLCHELSKAGIEYQQQLILPIVYDGITLDAGLRLDLLVADSVIVELKAIETLLPIHQAQVLTYLKLSKKRLGLLFLFNFNVQLLKHGFERIVL